MNQADPYVPSMGKALVLFKELLVLIRPYWISLLKTAIPVPAISMLEMAIPYLTKSLIDEVLPSRDVSLMHLIVGSILALTISSHLLKGIRNYYSLYITTKLNNVISLLFFNHIQHLSSRFFEKHQVGEVISRFQDVNSALGSISNIFSTFFMQGFFLLIVPPIIFLLNWELALISLISIPLTIVITMLAGRIMRKSWKETAEAYADYSAFQVEILSQIRSMKTMALEYFVYDKSKKKVEFAFKKNLKSEGISQLLGTINSILHALNTVLFTWIGWTLILHQEMSLGDYIAFTMYVGYLYSPFIQLVYLFSNFQHSAINLYRMFEYLKNSPEQEPTLVYQLPAEIQHKIYGEIEFKNIFFAYSSEKQTLTDLNFRVDKENIFAIVGSSGSGKTTILKLITSLEKPTSGKILFDHDQIENIPLNDLRRQMGVVWQDFNLFKGTIWDNITFGQNDINEHSVKEVIHICRLDSLVNELPEKYYTQVAEWGASLSGGQRQRIAIARALVRKTPILVLDEATSNIDIQTESEILKDIFDFSKRNHQTIILVTHRIVTASLANQICIVDSGQIKGIGKHEELSKNNSYYIQMLESSSRPK